MWLEVLGLRDDIEARAPSVDRLQERHHPWGLFSGDFTIHSRRVRSSYLTNRISIRRNFDLITHVPQFRDRRQSLGFWDKVCPLDRRDDIVISHCFECSFKIACDLCGSTRLNLLRYMDLDPLPLSPDSFSAQVQRSSVPGVNNGDAFAYSRLDVHAEMISVVFAIAIA